MEDSMYLRQGATLTVCPEGRLDAVSSPALEKELLPRLDGIRDVIMDLANVEYVSSSGMRMMLTIEQQLEDRGGRLKVIHANANILEAFDIVGFMDVVDVIQD